MNQREKLLVGAVGLLVILWGGTIGWGRYQAALMSNQNQQSSAEQQLSQARAADDRGREAQDMLHGWRRQSLPTNLDIAKSLYQDWLRQQLVEAGLTVRELTESTSRSAQKHFSQVTFVVNAQGTLAELTDFLYRFYQSNHLHRISAATLTPTTTRRSLTVSLTIDALSLSECPRSDQLAEGSSDLFSESLEEFRQEIVSRNVFVAYDFDRSEPQESIQQVAESPDEAAQAKITGMTYGEGGWQMTIRMGDSGRVRYFRQGDSIEIGRFSGEIVELDGRRAIVSRDDQHVLILLG
ncbi:MAG: hypothetical protein IH898_08285, partial [Planctomycetes bacterium]|nr:hypothetical protein [Planctomycetota bacterium]